MTETQMQSADSPPVVEISRPSLLSVPGEIRNRIYSFAVEKDIISLKHASLLEYSEALHINNILANEDERQRQFFSFTQLCRVIRSEYRPMYMAQTTVAVNPEWALDYIEDYLLVGRMNKEDAIGNVIMNLDMAEDGVDVKPLLKLLEVAKNVSIEVKIPSCFSLSFIRSFSRKRLMGALLNVYRWSLFHRYLEKAVTALKFNHDDDFTITTKIYNKDNCWGDWFDVYSLGTLGAMEPHIQAQISLWARKSGINARVDNNRFLITQFCYVP